jgi:hypothetical protein
VDVGGKVRRCMKEEKERCVMCGELTDIDVKTDVEARETYIAGVGQLCGECYVSIYGKGGKN